MSRRQRSASCTGSCTTPESPVTGNVSQTHARVRWMSRHAMPTWWMCPNADAVTDAQIPTAHGCPRSTSRRRLLYRLGEDTTYSGNHEPLAVVLQVARTQARQTLALERELGRVGAEVRREDRVCVSGVIFPAEFVEGTFRGRD